MKKSNDDSSAGNLAPDILERVSDAFVVLNKKWCFTYANHAAGQMFGHLPEDLIGKNICAEFPESVRLTFRRACEQAMAEQTGSALEEYYPPYNRWFAFRIHPSPAGLSIFFHDITGRKRAEALMAAQKEILEMMATGAPLPEVLSALIRLMESQLPSMIGSILLLDDDGVHIRHGAAPGLPPE